MTHSFRLNGQTYRIDATTVHDGVKDQVREDIRDHWVEIDGVRWPVKQVFAATLGVRREEFVSHAAIRHLRAVVRRI